MKLSFSTKGWHTPTFEQFCEVAEDLRFQGIELHNIYNRLFTDKDGAFHDYAAAATRRRLFEKGLDIPCIDTVCNASEGATDRGVEEITRCLEIASNLGIPCVRLKAANADDTAAGGLLPGNAHGIQLTLDPRQGLFLLAAQFGIFMEMPPQADDIVLLGRCQLENLLVHAASSLCFFYILPQPLPDYKKLPERLQKLPGGDRIFML